MNIRKTALLAAFTALSLSSSSDAYASADFSEAAFSPKVIYGADNRQNLYEVTDAMLLDSARSTVALFKNSDLRTLPSSKMTSLPGTPFGPTYGMCKDERFYDETVGAFCSGSLVGPDLVMTAGHCIENRTECDSTKIVFDYSIPQVNGSAPREVPSTQVYGCKKVIAQRLDNGVGVDYSIIQLDRPVTDRKPLRLARKSQLDKGTPVVVIGHPTGLPTKVSGGAAVRAIKNGYFVANLDTYGGNSGSAVLNGVTGEIEGILVRGETDYVRRSNPDGTSCRTSNRCSDGGCRGEDVTLIREVVKFVPEL